jgi:small subunit ribosomal protein S6
VQVQVRSMRDNPGTLREFETVYILKPDTAEDRIAQLNQRMRTLIEEKGGKLLKVDNWGKRRLAYEVHKQLKGIYLVWRYLAPSALPNEISRQLRLQDAVIRHLTLFYGDNVRPDLRQPEVDDEKFAAAGKVGPDEEEIAMGAAPAFGEEGEGGDVEAPESPEAGVEAGAQAEAEAENESAPGEDAQSDVVAEAAPAGDVEAAAPDRTASAAGPAKKTGADTTSDEKAPAKPARGKKSNEA